MAYGGPDKYYNPDDKVVNDGDVARADDLNSINFSTDAAFEQVASDLDGLLADVQEEVELARRWAEEDEDVVVAGGEYSAYHWAQKAQEYIAALDAASLLTLIKTVDGAASGLDADLLDGQQGSYYAPLASPTFTGTPAGPTQAVDNSSTRLATTAFVHDCNEGQIQKSGLTGGTLTISAVEARNAYIQLTGTLTSNLTVELPAGISRRYWVLNSCTVGPYTVNVKVAGGTTNIPIAATKLAVFFTNVIDVYAGPSDLFNPYIRAATADTPAVNDNSTRVATTAYFAGQASTTLPSMDGVASYGTGVIYARQNHVHPTDTTRAPLDSPTFTGTVGGITKSMVGLGNVDNTSDLNKPVSTAQATAIAVVQSDVDAHEARTDNPHTVTKSQVGLGFVDNTSDASKPISTATQTALDLKAPIDSPTFTGAPAGPTAAVAQNTTQFATCAFVQNVVSGVITKTGLTGGTLTLAAADLVTNQTLRLQGTLTSNLTVTFPTSAIIHRHWMVSNECVGNYTVTLKPLTGTVGQVVVPPGTTVGVSSDGVNLYQQLDFFNTFGENKIINGDFSIWQRATSQLGQGYGSADRWYCDRNGSTLNFGQGNFVFGQTDVPGGPDNYALAYVTSVAGAGNYAAIEQRIENVGTLSGKLATLSFWAKADVSQSIAINLSHNFGSGGGATSEYFFYTGNVTLTTSWALYTISVVVPSISGWTKGTDGLDHLAVRFWFDAGSNFDSDTNALGQRSGTYSIAQVQFAEGPYREYKRRTVGEEYKLCQRYYQVVNYAWSGVVTSTELYFFVYDMKEPMRITPSAGTPTNSTLSRLNTPFIFPTSSDSGYARSTANSTGHADIVGSVPLSAEI
jgi:hypothetical protein